MTTGQTTGGPGKPLIPWSAWRASWRAADAWGKRFQHAPGPKGQTHRPDPDPRQNASTNTAVARQKRRQGNSLAEPTARKPKTLHGAPRGRQI
jgi:hypothetical protein